MEIIVAEDEVRQRNGIVSIIRSIDNTIKCIPFGDGAEVMEYLERVRYRVDVLITDINMPDLDGLELIRQVGLRDPNLPVVIISGYASFEYAQQAVRLGAFRYLLKPVDPAEVEAVLQEIWSMRPPKAHPSIDAGEDWTAPADRRELLERQLNRWVGGRLRDEEVEKLPELLHTRGGGCLVLSSFTPSRAFQDTDNQAGVLLVREMRELLRPFYRCYSFFQDIPGLEMVTVARRRQGAAQPDRKQLLEGWQESLRAQYGIGCFTYWGGWAEDFPQAVPALFQRDLLLHQYTRFVRRSHVALADDPPGDRCCGRCGVERLVEAVQAGDKTAAERVVRCFSQQLDPSIPALKMGLEDLTEQACRRLTPHLPELGELHAELLREEIAQAATLEELGARLYTLLQELQELVRGGKTSQQQLYYLKIKSYISHNYRQDITLEETAGYFRLNPSYFSSLVKSVFGRGFNTLVTELRLQRACELLRGTGHRVNEIGAMVGYADPSYFNRVFKKGVGMTPDHYRKSEGGDRP